MLEHQKRQISNQDQVSTLYSERSRGTQSMIGGGGGKFEEGCGSAILSFVFETVVL